MFVPLCGKGKISQYVHRSKVVKVVSVVVSILKVLDGIHHGRQHKQCDENVENASKANREEEGRHQTVATHAISIAAN